MKTLRWIGPWIVGLTILAVLLARVDGAAMLQALATASFARYLSLSLVFIGIWLTLDVLALRALLPEGAPVPSLRTLALLRAASYPFLALNFHAASAALAATLGHELRIGLARASGSLLAYYSLDLIALTGLALLGSFTLDASQLQIRGPLAALACAAILIVVATRGTRRWLKRQPLLRVLSELPPRRLWIALFMRASMHASFAVFIVLGSACFGAILPWGPAIAQTPLVLAIGALPISVGSVGTAQAAIAFFFRDFASQERLLAFGLAYTFSLLVLRVPIGLVALWIRGRAPAECVEMRA